MAMDAAEIFMGRSTYLSASAREIPTQVSWPIRYPFRVWIPKGIKVLSSRGSNLLSELREKECMLSELVFEEESELKEIGDRALLRENKLLSIRIPRGVEIFGTQCFAHCYELEEMIFEDDTKLKVMGEGALSLSGFRWIRIPKSVEVIGPYCFAFCKRVESVIFDDDSDVRRIEEAAFYDSSLKSIGIPKNLEFIHPSGLEKVKFLTVDSANVHFSFDGHALYACSGRILVRLITDISRFVVPKIVEVLGEKCFYRCESLSEIIFEEDSELTRVEKFAFYSCAAESIRIPRKVEILSDGCFAECQRLHEVIIADDSELRRIESKNGYSRVRS
jgi:hypothetical protein